MSRSADISKQVWKFQEGLAYLALEEVIGPSEVIHWNFNKSKGNKKKDYTPRGMSIDPDLVIGADYNNPDSLVFVTHASMEHGSEKKFWRTVPEAIEEKALASHPKILSILYAGNVKANIMDAYEYLFDGVYHLDKSELGVELSAALMQLTGTFGAKAPLECLDILKTSIIQNRPDLWMEYKENISRLYHSGYGKKHEALVSLSDFKKSRRPAARFTSLRQSICKLATLPNDTRDEIITGKTEISNVPKHALILGWFKPLTIKDKYRLVDNELLTFIKETPVEIIEFELLKTFSCETLMESIHTLQLVNSRYEINDWIIEHFEELVDPERMLEYLNSVFYNAYLPLRERIEPELCPTSHWLFESIMSMLRTETGRADGYGYSSLANDVGETNGITGGYIYVADFSNRKNEVNLALNRKIAEAFSRHFVRLGKTRVSQLLSSSVTTLSRSLFNYNISTYRNHNPIDWLVCSALTANHIEYEYPSGHESFLSEYLKGNATSTNHLIKIKDGQTWIKCQSAYNGKTDKRKELCGRVGAMKLCYSPEELKSIHFYLVIDGYFDNADIELLDSAGWDGIFYYDEIETLIKEIHG